MEIINTERIKSFLAGVSLVSILFYLIGFLIWNLFLFGLKFNEIEILQSRFIYTGFFFVLYLLIFYIIKKAIFVLLKYILPADMWWDQGWLNVDGVIKYSKRLFLIMIAWLVIYSFFLFPIIPRVFGGGRPLAMSILPNGSTLTLVDLNKMGILSAQGSDIQTANLCVAYENSNIVLVLLLDRVVQLNKSQFNGIAVLPGDKNIEKQERACASLARDWSLSGYFGLLSQ